MNVPSPAAGNKSATFPCFGLAPWAIAVPFLAVAAIALGKPSNVLMAASLAVVLGGAIMSAVYHAEAIAHRVGEPFGTLILAFAVTVIETSLIVSIMLSEGNGAQALARDTVIAAVMITINGIVGVCLLLGGGRHHEQGYTQSGVNHGLAILATLSVLTLVMPNYTTSQVGPFYNEKQLIFVGVVSLMLYGTFVVAQTIRHRDHFLYPEESDDGHEKVPVNKALAAGVMLLVALVAVVMLAKALSPSIEAGVAAMGAPHATVGIIIAALVLAPESLAALGAARANRVQTSLNLAIGSALATIGLTIPAVAVASMWMGLDLELGLSIKSTVLLALTLLVATLTLSTGRTTLVQGMVHLVIFATYLFTTLVP
ncbi:MULTISPECIES: calcium:proton antiporter [Novosphingobium]|uniref:calcium:proton antiporter n=1 Tax=unclassified Novosphingobium TaxID=2644732 RepID=UPI0006C89F72|nr:MULTISPECIES: ionic transporter y4hA [unclassified Novosphingobium]KPH57527.1 ionic transporter y4hA [Novosphingobium sp. ST904]MPS67552.1 ionic transporter y4hA [Novosphingobium sp.]TCM43093.1 Ca2+:H+ antiporter [Novosphingobium sp. ST904]